MVDRLFKRVLPADNIVERYVDMSDDTYAKRMQALSESECSFLRGEAFRTFYEFDLSDTESFVVLAAATADTVLEFLEVTLTLGEIRVETYAGDGTPGGTFSTTLPIIPVNTMSDVPSPAPVSGVTLSTGGTYTGGTQLDLSLLKTDTNSNKSRLVDFQTSASRAVSAGTFYYKITATGASKGVFSARWHEHFT